MTEHVAVPESQFAILASMETEFDDATKLAVMITTLKDHNEFEPFITQVGVMIKKMTRYKGRRLHFSQKRQND